MLGKTAILSFLLATTRAHKYDDLIDFLPDACADAEGTFYNESCVPTPWWLLFWGDSECEQYTCDTAPCESDTAKKLCPATCGDCTTVVDIATGDGNFTTLVDFLLAADLVSTLQKHGPYTVFAPTNDAFDNLDDFIKTNYAQDQWKAHLKALLLYHVLFGEVTSGDITEGLEATTLEGSTITASLDPLTINDAEVIAGDIFADNGVVHVIDDVLLPPFTQSSVVDVAISKDILSTLVELVVAANLTEVLASEGSFTVFAPTNDAFSKIAGVIDVNNVTQITEVLLYHVLGSVALSEDITDGLEVETLSGENISFSIKYYHSIVINDDSLVIEEDVLVSNGVIHVIDEVLLPPGYERPCVDADVTSWGHTCDEIGASYFTWFYCLFTDECPETCGYCK